MKLERKQMYKEIMEWIYCIIIAVVLALIVRYYIGTPTVVQMKSMDPTFKQGDRLILNRLYIHLKKELKRGDVITFEAPTYKYNSVAEVDLENPIAKYKDGPQKIFTKFLYNVLDIGKKSYIKRVIGLPGEYVEINNGNVYINGNILQEEYLQPGVETSDALFSNFTVPEGYIFVMGDNRPGSMDSRVFGCVPLSKVESKVLLRFWPFSKFGRDW